MHGWKSTCKLCSTLFSWVLVYTVEQTVEMWSISHNNTCAHMIYHYQCSQFGIDLFSSLFSLSWPCEYSAHMSISWPFLIRYLQVPSASIGFMYNILVMEVDIRTCHWNVGIVVSWFDTGKRPPFPQWAFIGPSKFLDLNHSLVHCRLFSLLFSMHTCLWLGRNGTYMSRHDGTFSFELSNNFQCEDGISWASWT